MVGFFSLVILVKYIVALYIELPFVVCTLVQLASKLASNEVCTTAWRVKRLVNLVVLCLLLHCNL
jgi:hypothetical protein